MSDKSHSHFQIAPLVTGLQYFQWNGQFSTTSEPNKQTNKRLTEAAGRTEKLGCLWSGTCGASEMGVNDLLTIWVQVYEHPQDEFPCRNCVPLGTYTTHYVNSRLYCKELEYTEQLQILVQLLLQDRYTSFFFSTDLLLD
ncbi:hypothetical protein J6590_014122 [Homalodisca vitripennis]|nr:hypothetical protein J6590_014122 [Homalodisca vitripennis]